MCTALTLKTGDFYFGRNFDWEFSYGESVTVTPRNFSFEFSDGTKSYCHYAIIGTAFVEKNYPLYFDGTNEVGLSMAGLNFPGNACYSKPRKDMVNIASYELINRILSTFATASEAAEFLKNANITNVAFNEKLKPSPLHWIIADCNDCYVAEPMESGIRIYKNDFGVLTNNPPFEYHIQNMANYMNLNSTEPSNNIAPGVSVEPYSRGMGAIGLPGDWSSTSRFVRTAFERAHSVSAKTEWESVSQFFHILSSAMHIRGCVRLPENKYEITQYSSCCNTKKGIYYYKTYDSSRINAVNMYNEKLDSSSLISYQMSNDDYVNYVN